MTENIFIGMSESAIRERVVAEARKLLGVKEGTAEHKRIVDTYNTLPKLPRGYKLQYDDAWCAGTMSYIGIVLGITDVILPECSCSKMIELYKARAGGWKLTIMCPSPVTRLCTTGMPSPASAPAHLIMWAWWRRSRARPSPSSRATTTIR